jgi:hypothetical protein
LGPAIFRYSGVALNDITPNTPLNGASDIIARLEIYISSHW